MGALNLATLGNTITGVLVTLGVLAGFASRASRQQRSENRRLRALVLDYDAYLYVVERSNRRRGAPMPPKPRSIAEAHDDEPDLDQQRDPQPPDPAEPDPGVGGGSRHALRER